jgi:hypothetical protein
MMSKPPIDARISTARSRLATNIGQLQERMTRARDMVSPSAYLKSPWLKVGAGIAIGLLVGRRRRAPLQLTAGGSVAAPASPGLLRAAVMATVTSLARVMIERVVNELNEQHDDDD